MFRNKNTPFSIPFQNYGQKKSAELSSEISNTPEDYFETITEAEFIEYLVDKYTIEEFPTVNWEETAVEVDDIMVPITSFPDTYDKRDKNLKMKRNQVSFSVPFEGDDSWFKYTSPTRTSIGGAYGDISINSNNIIFSLVDRENKPESVEAAFEQTKSQFQIRLKNLNAIVTQFNSELFDFSKALVNKRLAEIKNKNTYKSKFNYPIKRRDNAPVSLKIPSVVKRKKIQPTAFSPDSHKMSNQKFISEDDYMYILNLLQACGSNWEQHPETYHGKGEEALRDQLIFALAPNIEGVVAGEAYNKGGKTDISIKHLTNNLFIAECKIWTGPKGFSDTIDQILGYLTWRDSKAAILMFVPNKDISTVRATTEKTMKEHPNYVRTLSVENPGWVNYKLHLHGDPGSFLTIAVQLCHLEELK